MTVGLDVSPGTSPGVSADLRRLRVTCGSPTLQQICEISERLSNLYGKEYGFQSLSTTTVSEILSGNRKAKWERVRVLVLSMNRYAFESGGIPVDPGLDALPAWLRKLNAVDGSVQPNAAVAGADAAHERSASTQSSPHEELVLHVLAALGNRGLVEPTPDNTRAEPSELDDLLKRLHLEDPLAVTARRYWELFGDLHVVELLHSAHDRGDPESAGRLAVLLLCVGLAGEAQQWLEIAAAAGEPLAETLKAADPRYRRGLAVGYAFEIAAQESSSTGATAEMYGQVAARCGLAGAAYWLAARHADRQDIVGAAYWFTEAAREGHQDAGGRFEEILQKAWKATDPSSITVQRLSDEWEAEPAIEERGTDQSD